MTDDVKAAQKNIAHVSFGRSFVDQRPATLAVLREVTAAFRDDEPIWLTNFSLEDGRVGRVSGKTTENRYVLAVFDRLAKNPHLSQLNSGGYSVSGTKTPEQAFSFTFVYNPQTPATQPAATGGGKSFTRAYSSEIFTASFFLWLFEGTRKKKIECHGSYLKYICVCLCAHM